MTAASRADGATGPVLALIAARAGSKGLPGKNTRPLAGKPLVVWSIEAALESPAVDQLLVTSDDPAVLSMAAEHGAQLVDRPLHLSTDDASIIDVVMHALDQAPDLPSDTLLVLLQPTSPLRTAGHITAAVQAFRIAEDCRSLISVCEGPACAHKMLAAGSDGRLRPLTGDVRHLATPRQELPPVYRQNGAIYLIAAADLRRTRSFFVEPCLPFVMDAAVSVDIDTRLDFEAAEGFIKQNAGLNCR